MKFKPHSYQAEAIRFLEDKPAAALFLDLGLGKTIITLTSLQDHMFNRFTVVRPLVIAPLRVARDTWPEEVDKWDHLHGLQVAVMVGSPKQRMEALRANADIWVVNRENIPWLVKEVGKSWPFDTVIIDELSSFKSHQSQRFKALKAVRPFIHRIVGLTGTPAPNSLLDLWAPFRILDEGQRLGQRIGQYRDRYFIPGKRNGHIVYEWKLRPGADDQIHAHISDITMSMEAKDHLDMPPLTVVDRKVKLSSSALSAYKDLKKDMVAELENDLLVADSAAVLSGKLQQLASGAIYVDEEHNWMHVHDAKLEALDDVIEEANGHNILVAYWFKHELERLQASYPKGRLLDTDQDMADWKAGKIQLGFIHPASAGHGLNLQSGGHIMVWLTTPWSLELVQQTNGRLYRQGQDQPVTIVRILAEDTIDSKVVDALENKNTTQSALIDAVKAELEGLKKMIDQWALQAAAVDALDGFTELWTLKVGATHAPRRERIQQATPGPASPNGDNDLTLNLEMILLGSVVQDKQPDIPVGLHRLAAHAMTATPAHGMAVAKSGITCCELVKIYSYDISEKFDRAEELHDLLTDQARYLSRFVSGQYQKIHGDDTKLSDDPFLDATSLQRAVKLRGQEVLPETVRQWAMRGHVAISRSMTGKRTYRLADVMARIEAA